MAKYKNYKVSWKPSTSDHVAGYRLYWSEEDTISYDSDFIELGDVCEVTLPDIFRYPPSDCGPLRLGISAVDTEGNESDIAIFSEVYQAAVLAAPSDLSMISIDDYTVLVKNDEGSKNPEDDLLEELAGMADRLKGSSIPQSKAKYHNYVGYSKLEFDE